MMKGTATKIVFGLLIAAVMPVTGCSYFYIVDRSMTIQEIVAMSGAGVDADVMIAQIDATHTRFQLTSEELIWLKESDVPDDVVEYMIETGITPERYAWEDIYDPIVGYPYYGYYGPFYRQYYYPYYNSGIYYSGGPYRMYHPYVVRREPGIVGRFYEYRPAPGYQGKDSRRYRYYPERENGEPENGAKERRRPDTGNSED